MKNNKKIATVAVLLSMAVFFSGCSISKKADVETKVVPELTPKKEEVEKVDTDKDGLFDDEEEKLGTDINVQDSDGDGLTDFDEVNKTKIWKSDPLSRDTDGDGYEDKTEVSAGYDPNGPGQLDSDSDGLFDPEEKRIGTDPQLFDTDGDGLNDKEEIDAGRDPLVVG